MNAPDTILYCVRLDWASTGKEQLVIFPNKIEAQAFMGIMDLCNPECVPAAAHLGKAPELFTIDAHAPMFIVSRESDYEKVINNRDAFLLAEDVVKELADTPIKTSEAEILAAARNGIALLSRSFRVEATEEDRAKFGVSHWNTTIDITYVGTATTFMNRQHRETP